jgi:sulfur carrier protein ThiS
MTIIYQGKPTETDATTVAEFLEPRGGVKNAVIEYKGEILSGEASGAAALEDGAELNAYRIVAGG